MDVKWQSRQRVEQMESIFHSQFQLVSALQSLLEQVETSQQAYLKLLDYYQSPTFLEDMDLADRGEFKHLTCGVLSEDGVYNLLIDRKELAAKLRECANFLDA
ncbi:DUF4298 domain-containing protein [Streptococcus iners]|uniref:DUF4298 domain-containing protein n=1 Tax=Streptococcus iners TaxID=3028084 RepID=A0AA97A2X7_9STRE|nr:DUF4298 domain-containing protein [Streptococcus sp. 29887]MCK4025496.1 DUF4298 domain-containing protein [Streptococcus suis]WNY50149.1 DUF4298 domain-containing protein [Streptococcus sp. 29887]